MAILHLKAKPGSRVNQLQLGPDGQVTVRLNAPAQEGQANAALLAFLATTFGIAKTRVVLLAGHTSPFKKVELQAISPEEMAHTLARFRA
ncbi:DUF167 family protein [Hymenobacter sp. DH14]|uniref:UPF0235 protein MON38_19180 n=1 Tax=Hymenobacter cyanobacteriorum TaxID=2926463 RepID=A0A9X1VIN7_9BACT|nr:DUF167 family protein [Hymenobacter cyanobacteriorum]MCI1189552.1 DUF167 family protein [Hymenobacter cyanobacteriorum]